MEDRHGREKRNSPVTQFSKVLLKRCHPACRCRRPAGRDTSAAARTCRRSPTRAIAISNAPARARARAVPIDSPLHSSGRTEGCGDARRRGDSWFDYPWGTTSSTCWRTSTASTSEPVARAGDRIEDMAYTGGQLANFKKVLEKMLRRVELPKAVLLSGGGNDVAGDEFFMLLNHASSANPWG